MQNLEVHELGFYGSFDDILFLGCERLGEATYTVARLHRTDG